MSYSTSDLNIAAYLMTKGYTLHSLESANGNPRRAVMHFEPAAKAAADDYFTGAEVPARSYVAMLRELKARIRHELRVSS